MQAMARAGFMFNLCKCRFCTPKAVVLGRELLQYGYRLLCKFLGGHLHSPHISIVVKFTRQIIVLFRTYSRVQVTGCTSRNTVVSKGPGQVDQGLHRLAKHVVTVGF